MAKYTIPNFKSVTPLNLNSIRTLCALSAGLAFPVAAIAQPLPAGTAIRQSASQQIKISAVDANTFHLVAYPAGEGAPPASPFVVKTTTWPNARVQTRTTDSSVTVPGSNLDIDSEGNWQLKGPNNLLLSGRVTVNAGKTIFTLKHAEGERFYGAGNSDRNRSGDLTHPSGNTIVANGATRVAYLWSTGGYSVFVANNQLDVSWNDQEGTLTWTIPNSFADIYLSFAPTPYGLLDSYARLTGPAPIPPRWTFGFLMSRWGYKDNADIRDKWHQFRDREIPVDAFIYDYDWFNNDWEFNQDKFTAADITEMHKLGLKFVGIRKPRVNGSNLDLAKKQGWILPSSGGTDLRFDIPEATYWWWSHQAPLVKAGADGWWNDEAEQTLDEFFQMSRVQWEGWHQMSPRRAWVINRAFAPGIQRYGAATWTGDIDARWDVIADQPGTMLNWSLAGMPYSSQDSGGFIGVPTPDLYARWIESSVFIPVMRAHGWVDSPRWPWAFGDDVLAATKKAIELRYRLVPYIYTFAEQNWRTGAPLMRPLLLEFPNDAKTINLHDQWLLGDRLMAAPILTENGQRDVYLPAGQWYDFNTNAPVQGDQTLQVKAPLDTIPAYVRAGSIIPLGPVIQATSLGQIDPLEVRVYPGANASFSLYEDEGDNYDYQKGASTRIPMSWNDATSTLTIGKRTGSYPGMLATRNIVAVVPGKTEKKAVYNGNPITIKF